MGEENVSDLGRLSRLLLDQRRSRLNLDGVVPVVEARDEVDEVDDESVIDGTQFGRGNTESW